MTAPMDYYCASPAGMQALAGVYNHVMQSGLPKELVKLVFLRTAQINGCAYCIDMHSRDLLKQGVAIQKLVQVPAWREAGALFDAAERAALAWVETVTRVGETGVPDAEFEAAAAVFEPGQLADLTIAVGLINAYSRLAIERSLREALAQLETLYRELTHRVKNHLQIMSGFISMEARDPALTVGGLAELMKGRICALAAVYDSMTRAGAGGRVVAGAFVEEVSRCYESEAVKVKVAVDPPDLTLDSEQAGQVGILANEAMSNSYKHAFLGRGGRIWVSLRRLEPGRLRLEIADDGVGWRTGAEGRASHGLDLMRLFAKQLHGELELGDRPGGGALVAAELPEAVESAPDARDASPPRSYGRI